LTLGYKVGRVDQSETALGAEMRVAANKSRGKIGDDKQKEKIVRRCVVYTWQRIFCLTGSTES
jgi:DNA mismatch repair protein MSH6